MTKLFKRLGFQIILISVLMVLITTVVSQFVTMMMFRNYNDNILVERAYIGMQVLKDTLDDEISTLQDTFVMWTESMYFEGALGNKNTELFQSEWPTYRGSSGDFCVVIDLYGDVIYKSDNCKLSGFDISGVVLNKKVTHGIVNDNGNLVALYASPVSDGSVKGGLIIGFNMSDETWMENVKKLTECDVSIFLNNIRYSTTIVDPSTGGKATGTTMDSSVKSAVIDGQRIYEGSHDVMGKPYYVSYEPMFDVNASIVGAYFAGSDATDANGEFGLVTVISAIVAIAGIVASGLILMVFTRKRVVTPIKHVSTLADEMQSGQLSTTAVDYWFADDEIGKFAQKLRYTKKAISGCILDISQVLNGMAEGDFTISPSAQYPGEFETIEQNIVKIEEDLGDTLSKMNISSDEVLSGSNQMAEGSQSLADGTTRQASAIEEISATITDVSSKIAKTAENAARAGELSRQTEEKINYQDAEIKSMVEAMNGINETSKEIGRIIKTIEDISFQTNILALNAAVEAARAGDAGKGFAVVADEVRNLATKSDEAAKSTASLINAAIEAIGKGSEIAFATAEAMKEVKDISNETSGLIIEIADASAEQNESIKQITGGVEQISQVIQMNSATAEETAASCQELSGQSRLLKDQVSRFRINQ